ncbi:MAG: hypothetical protein J2P48_06885 [Alphaproteobacteria bacterium]|nr:hypothetical protein [Alphaproteobacteria bacterium]
MSEHEQLEPFWDCTAWQCPMPTSQEEADALRGFEAGRWYIVDRKLVFVGGPYDTEQDASRALRQLNRDWRGFGPHRPRAGHAG